MAKTIKPFLFINCSKRLEAGIAQFHGTGSKEAVALDFRGDLDTGGVIEIALAITQVHVGRCALAVDSQVRVDVDGFVGARILVSEQTGGGHVHHVACE